MSTMPRPTKRPVVVDLISDEETEQPPIKRRVKATSHAGMLTVRTGKLSETPKIEEEQMFDELISIPDEDERSDDQSDGQSNGQSEDHSEDQSDGHRDGHSDGYIDGPNKQVTNTDEMAEQYDDQDSTADSDNESSSGDSNEESNDHLGGARINGVDDFIENENIGAPHHSWARSPISDSNESTTFDSNERLGDRSPRSSSDNSHEAEDIAGIGGISAEAPFLADGDNDGREGTYVDALGAESDLVDDVNTTFYGEISDEGHPSDDDDEGDDDDSSDGKNPTDHGQYSNDDDMNIGDDHTDDDDHESESINTTASVLTSNPSPRAESVESEDTWHGCSQTPTQSPRQILRSASPRTLPPSPAQSAHESLPGSPASDASSETFFDCNEIPPASRGSSSATFGPVLSNDFPFSAVNRCNTFKQSQGRSPRGNVAAVQWSESSENHETPDTILGALTDESTLPDMNRDAEPEVHDDRRSKGRSLRASGYSSPPPSSDTGADTRVEVYTSNAASETGYDTTPAMATLSPSPKPRRAVDATDPTRTAIVVDDAPRELDVTTTKPLQNMSPAFRKHHRLHSRLVSFIPQIPWVYRAGFEWPARRYWIAVIPAVKVVTQKLMPTPSGDMVPRRAITFTIKDVIWMKGNKYTTMRTIMQAYYSRTLLGDGLEMSLAQSQNQKEEFFLLGGTEKVRDLDTSCQAMDLMGDKVVVFVAGNNKQARGFKEVELLDGLIPAELQVIDLT